MSAKEYNYSLWKSILPVKLMKKSEIIKAIKRIFAKNRIKEAYLFGSFTRSGEKYNDIDIAIEPPEEFTLLDLSRVANALEKKTGVGVDLVTLRSMKPGLRRMVEKEMVAL